MLITDKHIFFYTSWPSNFKKTKFNWEAFGESHTFFCTEQAFMWAKAMYFNDKEVAEKILAEISDPMTCKFLGRMVKNYDDKRWSLVRFSFMFDVNLCKYQQDKALQLLLLDKKFDNKTFVEASPSDRIWGIGLGLEQDENYIDDESNWKGTNLLGKVLTQVREIIIKDLGYRRST